jgi:sugar lactone lactonase YvrE
MPKPELEEVASFPHQQVTGVAVSASGRIFVSFPDWSDSHRWSVAELVDGKPRPYPDETWNSKTGPPSQRWVCVQSVFVDDVGALWVLDPASPKMEGVVEGGAKLVKINLGSNRVVQTISFNGQIAPPHSYLNDVRIDTHSGHAFITDSGMGAIVVVDLKSGTARRVLANAACTKSDPDSGITVDGTSLIDPKTGRPPAIHSDGIALDSKRAWLYFHALNSKSLYRVKTKYLLDPSLPADQLKDNVEKAATTPETDGMLEGPADTLYLTAIEDDAIVKLDIREENISPVIQDARLQWPDSMAWGKDGSLYVTTSQIHRMPKFHDGHSQQRGDYKVYRLRIP